MTYAFIPIFLTLIPIGIALVFVLLLRAWRKRDGRRSPLTEKLHYGPGEQLRQALHKSDEKVDEILLVLSLVGPFLLCALTLPKLDWSKVRLGAGEWVLVVLAVGVVVWELRKLAQLFNHRHHLREGLNAELMTAQLLLPLAAKGCQVFHDIPARGFNLDHVVIGPYAVFMVETKSRKKSGKGKQSAQVDYDGKLLHFPDHASNKPLEQARHEARWLADFLRQAAGEAVPVVPVVALPGWFVNSGRDAHRSDVLVLNPKMHGAFTEKRTGAPLSDSLRTRIIYALTQRYPTLP